MGSLGLPYIMAASWALLQGRGLGPCTSVPGNRVEAPSSPFFSIFFFLATLCGMRDPSSPTRDQTRAPAVESSIAFYDSAQKVTQYHLCQILLVTSGSQACLESKRVGTAQTPTSQWKDYQSHD